MHFCAGVARRLHAPLALVLKPLRSVRGDGSLSKGSSRGVSIVRRDTVQLLGLVGRVLRFEGARARGGGLYMDHSGLTTLMRRVKLGCGRLGQGPRVSFYLRVRRRSVSLFFSGRMMAVVLSGLVSGTVGCARGKAVALKLRRIIQGGVRRARVDIDSANFNVTPSTLPRVFSHCCRRKDRRRTSKANVNLTLMGGLMILRRKRVEIRDSLGIKDAFCIDLLASGACPRILRTSSARGASSRGSRGRRGVRPIRDNGHVLLVIRSGESVYSCVMRSFSSSFRIEATTGNRRNLRRTLNYVPSVVIDSVVVPIVGNVIVYQGLGRSLHADRVPVVLLATGSSLRSGRRKCRMNTSSCLAGPFDTALLRDHVRGLLRSHGLLTRHFGAGSVLVSGHTTMARSVGGLSGRFLRGVGGLVRSHLSSRGVSVNCLSSTVYVDGSALCQGVGTLAKLSAGRCVHGVGVRCTRHLLLRKGCGVSRITFGIKVGDAICFHRYFGSRFNVTPSSCLGGVGPR